MNIRITDIQHFCLHDGPGIRTTVFLKGCNLKCPWCANPECISYDFQEYDDNGIKGVFGYDISLKKLEQEILKDEVFYSINNGGVTFSGGEPLLQIKKLEPLLKSLKEKNINICIETALMCDTELVHMSSFYVDEYFVDIKVLDKQSCIDILNGNLDLYYENLDLLFFKKKKLTFRLPLVNEYTLNDDNINLICNFFKRYSHNKVEIFKAHNLAEKKYYFLNKKMIVFSDISDEKVQEIYNKLSKFVKNIEIIKL